MNKHQNVLNEVRDTIATLLAKNDEGTHLFEMMRSEVIADRLRYTQKILGAFLADVPLMLPLPEGRILGVSQRIESLIDNAGAYKSAALLHTATTKGTTDD